MSFPGGEEVASDSGPQIIFSSSVSFPNQLKVRKTVELWPIVFQFGFDVDRTRTRDPNQIVFPIMSCEVGFRSFLAHFAARSRSFPRITSRFYSGVVGSSILKLQSSGIGFACVLIDGSTDRRLVAEQTSASCTYGTLDTLIAGLVTVSCRSEVYELRCSFICPAANLSLRCKHNERNQHAHTIDERLIKA